LTYYGFLDDLISRKWVKMDVLKAVFDSLKPLMTVYQPPLVAIADYESRYELYTDKPVTIDGRFKPTLAFSALIIQTGYVGFYFMPIYTNPKLLSTLKPDLRKLLKGKSCFHIKKIDEEVINQIKQLLELGFNDYKMREWI
jgi:hypothetical protein